MTCKGTFLGVPAGYGMTQNSAWESTPMAGTTWASSFLPSGENRKSAQNRNVAGNGGVLYCTAFTPVSGARYNEWLGPLGRENARVFPSGERLTGCFVKAMF